jgi:hypothetical protein
MNAGPPGGRPLLRTSGDMDGAPDDVIAWPSRRPV